MLFPELKKWNNIKSAELKKWSSQDIENVVISYLYEGLSTREIDRQVLDLNPDVSKGFVAMNILHAKGLTTEHKGIFIDKAEVEIESVLKNNLLDFNFIDKVKIDRDKNPMDILSSTTKRVEGKKIGYYTYRYERNKYNRDRAIAFHGCKCNVCGFDFEKVYGERGKGFIEVHHIKPLYTLDEKVEINPEEDLIPLCANCHRMVHTKKDETLSIEVLKEILKNKNIEEATNGRNRI